MSEYADQAPTYEAVIAKAIADWERLQSEPLSFPVDERRVGSLALLITRRLVKAGLIDLEPKKQEM